MTDPTTTPSCSACSEPIPDPAGRRARQPVEPSHSMDSDDLAKQLADAARLIPPMPPGPRPGDACLYTGGEVFYVDPAFGDRLESWEYGDMPELVDLERLRLAKLFEALQIRRLSPFRFDAY